MTTPHLPTQSNARVIGAFRIRNFFMYPYTNGYHMGTDWYAIARPGDENVLKSKRDGKVKPSIYAMMPGKVDVAEYSRVGGYGRRVIIQHDVGKYKFKTLYAHLDTIFVNAGDSVNAGSVIGLMGGGLDDNYRGASKGTHLHEELILPYEPQDIPFVKTVRGWSVESIPWLEARFLPSPIGSGYLVSKNGVNIRKEASTKQNRTGTICYAPKKKLFFSAFQKDNDGRMWGLLNTIKKDQWVACFPGIIDVNWADVNYKNKVEEATSTAGDAVQATVSLETRVSELERKVEILNKIAGI